MAQPSTVEPGGGWAHCTTQGSNVHNFGFNGPFKMLKEDKTQKESNNIKRPLANQTYRKLLFHVRES